MTAGRPNLDPKDDTERVSLRLPKRLLAKIDAKAAKLGMRRSSLIRAALAHVIK
jgi:metal-responsive CopG/Arc/MetJ family transcriptional regulator